MNLVAVFPSAELAREAVARLERQGFTWDSIGLAVRLPDDPPPASSPEAPRSRSTASTPAHRSPAVVGALSGAGLGGLFGLSLVGTTVNVPGIGPVLISGPLATLIGAGLGMASGGLLGTLIDSGIPETEAPDYLKRIQDGHVLVTVDVDNDSVDRARQALEPPDSRH